MIITENQQARFVMFLLDRFPEEVREGEDAVAMAIRLLTPVAASREIIACNKCGNALLPMFRDVTGSRKSLEYFCKCGFEYKTEVDNGIKR